MAEQRLKDKVAIVSGAGTRGPMPGTGQATAILYARHGAKVLLSDLDLARAEETQAAIAAEGGIASVFQADVTNEADCRAMIEVCVERYSGLHVLFNNVGGIGSGMVTGNRGRISGPLTCSQSKRRHFYFKTRHPRNDRVRRRFYHQRFVHRRATSRLDTQCALCCLQSWACAIDARDGSAPWPRQYPRELHRPRVTCMRLRGEYQRRAPRVAKKAGPWARKAMPGTSLGRACSWRVMNRVGYLALFCQSTPGCWQPLH